MLLGRWSLQTGFTVFQQMLNYPWIHKQYKWKTHQMPCDLRKLINLPCLDVLYCHCILMFKAILRIDWGRGKRKICIHPLWKNSCYTDHDSIPLTVSNDNLWSVLLLAHTVCWTNCLVSYLRRYHSKACATTKPRWHMFIKSRDNIHQ